MMNPMRKQYPDSTFVVTMTMILLIMMTTFNKQSSYFAEALFEEQSVQVSNDVGPGTTMKIQCKSGDEELAVKYLAFNEFFRFSFRILWRTMYWCNMYWDNKIHSIKAFDVDRRDNELCQSMCYWKIQRDGAYLMRELDHGNSEHRGFVKLYSW
ncbi:hypothetical protein QYF36_002621 [Acer negundo]|nr:hypothetical protein QYF36_002621 [Acer negundo]